jgi:polysaccharide pyruvyl transferase WcaK-like protein
MAKRDRRAVFLYGYYGAGNLGDDLLLTVLVNELRSIVPQAKFLVRDHGDTSLLATLDPNVTFTGIEAIIANQSRARPLRLFAYLRAYARAFRQCSWLIFGGGTLFHARGSLTSLLLQLAICVLARIHGLRIAALAVGVAELRSPAARWLLRRIIGMSDLFLVRDEAALRQCVGTKAQLTADLVFAWSQVATLPRRTSDQARRLSLTVYPPVCEGPTGSPTRTGLVEAVRHWRASGYGVVGLACQSDRVATGDEKVLAQLSQELAPKDTDIGIVRLAADARELSREFADIDIVCGMRFHALVLAAIMGRPFVGIAYDNKISEICRRFDMPCVAMENLNAADLAAAVNAIKNRIPDPQLVESCRNAARENFRAFAAVVT